MTINLVDPFFAEVGRRRQEDVNRILGCERGNKSKSKASDPEIAGVEKNDPVTNSVPQPSSVLVMSIPGAKQTLFPLFHFLSAKSYLSLNLRTNLPTNPI